MAMPDSIRVKRGLRPRSGIIPPGYASKRAALCVPGPSVTTRLPINASRTTLTIGDGDRDWFYANTRGGDLAPSWTANGRVVPSLALPAIDLWYDSAYHGGFRLPSDAETGTISIDFGRGGTELVVTVLGPTIWNTGYLPANGSPDDFDKLIKDGFNDIVIDGHVTWDRMAYVPGYTRVRGRGLMARLAVDNPGEGGHFPLFYIGGPNVSFYGLSFVYGDNMAGRSVFFANPTETGLVVAGCHFYRCNFGFYFQEALIRDNTFAGGSVIVAPGGMYYRNLYDGPSTHGDPFQFWYGVGSMQMIEDTFRNTSRGPVFNALNNAFDSNFFSCVKVFDVIDGDNGNECWLTEGGPQNNLTILHSRMQRCESTFCQSDKGALNPLVRDFVQDGGVGLSWDPIPGTTIESGVVEDSQFIRCGGAYFGPGAKNNTLRNSLVIDFTPTRGNQTFNNGSPKGFGRKIAVWAEGPDAATNMIVRTPVLKLAPEYTAVTGAVAVGA